MAHQHSIVTSTEFEYLSKSKSKSNCQKSYSSRSKKYPFLATKY